VRLTKISAVAVAGLMALPLAACGSSTGTSGASSSNKSNAGVTLTYWASNQGTSLDNDKQVLTPELNKFTKETGIKVSLQVIPWTNLLNQILAATTSGKGPDVVNIGNTWSSSIQATGAFMPWDSSALATVGGKSRFLAGSMAATGVAGQPPVALPLYSLAYALYYNKKQFAAAGISGPPKTWTQFLADGKKLTTASHWALSLEGGSQTENIHNAFTLSQQQGGSFFDASGKPTFNTPQNVAAIKQYIDFMQTDKIVNPSDAQYSNGTEALKDFATGTTSMMLWQASAGSLNKLGMNPNDIGVAPVPVPATLPVGGKPVTSMVAGINLGIFKNTANQSAAISFVKFMTSTPEQEILNSAYGSLPSVTSAYSDPAFQTPAVKVFQNILDTSAAPMPQVAAENQFETLVGTAMTGLFANAATGKAVTSAQIESALAAAQQQVTN
jgi:multiple sugar transport system substrate-binding protein